MSKAVLASTTKPLFYGFIIFISIQPILYWTISKLFAQGHKIFFYGMMIVMALTILKNRSVVKDNFIILLGIYALWLIGFGLALNPIGKATIAHLQPIFLPILAINFGYLIAKYHPQVLYDIYSGSFNLGLILSGIIIFYFFLYQLGLISYFGASSLIFIPIFWAFLERKWAAFLFFIFILLLTGKRSSTLAVAAVLICSLLSNLNIKQIFIVLGLTSIIPIIFGSTSDLMPNLFQRYDPLIEALNWNQIRLDGFSSIDLQLLDLATSGRINDFVGAANALNENTIFWIFGKGIGGTFEVAIANADPWVTHYSHFTPMSYMFLGGSLMLFIVYGKLLSLLLFSLRTINSFYSMLFLYWFIMSLIGGAIYFTDPFIWLFVGVLIYKKRCHKLETTVNNLH